MSIRRHSFLSFVILTFGITWGLGACFVLFPKQVAALFGQASLSNPLFIVAVYAPSLSALVMTAVTGGLSGQRRLFARFLRWRVGIQWYVAALVGLPVLSLLANLLNAALSGSPRQFAHWYDLFVLGPSGRAIIQLARENHGGGGLVILALITIFVSDPGPLGEELGWRGYALPILLKDRSAWAAGVILGVIWGVWHLPAFFISGLPQSSMALPVFLVSFVALSVLMTWVFMGARRSLLIAVMIHAMFNTYMDLTTMPLAMVTAGVLVVTAIAVVVKDRRMRLPVRTSPDRNLGSEAAPTRQELEALPTTA